MTPSPKQAGKPAPAAPPAGPVICEKGRHQNCIHTRRKAAP